jgi:integrase
MALKHSITTADYIDFDHATKTAKKLLRNPKTAYLGRYIIIAINTGLRNSDILQLQYEDLQKDIVTIREKKTNKAKKFAVNNNIRAIIPHNTRGSMFVGQIGDNDISIQHLNRMLKKVFSNEAQTLNISSHSLRKSFGRRVYESQNESEKALVLLSEMFNHSSTAITRRYLGIKQTEMDNVYLTL